MATINHVERSVNCPEGATSLNDLMDLIARGKHDINLANFRLRLGLDEGWDWSDVGSLVDRGELTADQIDVAIHAGLR